MEAKPLQIVPSSHSTSGGGPHKKIDNMGHKSKSGVVDEEKSDVVMKEELEKSSSIVEQKWCVFTEVQRCELDHQVSIFNHFAYNLPLPHYLLQFSTNMSEYTHLSFDQGAMVDPELNRCRRTDGKKWRCRKNTIPNQKYCERHMHRGRNRSRKPVEISQLNSPFTKKSFTIPTPNTESANSNPNPLVTSYSAATIDNSAAPTVITFSGMATVTSKDKSCVNLFKEDDQTKKCLNNSMSVKSGMKGSILCDSNGVSNRIGFSPKSVLQASGCNQSSHLNDRNNIVEPEPGRCRRTDGKKWRCKCAVLPGKKYCATHMHRGAKKRLTNYKAATTTTCSPAITIARLPYPSAKTNIQKAYCNEKSGSCSDTDTSTTITDTMNECSYVSF